MSLLETLHLSYNKLATLNTNIGLLRKLSSLQLNNNQIVEIPVSICKLVNLSEFTLDWLNYLDRKHVESSILRVPGRKKGQRLAKAEVGGKVFKEIAKMCKISEMVSSNAKIIKVHFVQFLMYFFKLTELEELKNIHYEFSHRNVQHILAQNGHLYLMKSMISILGLKR
jgi:Leucine-rich repeat (LRR) protein